MFVNAKYGDINHCWRKNIRQMILNDEDPIGLAMAIPSPFIVDIAAAAGMDFVWLDMEHSLFNPETICNIVRAADSAGIAVLARVIEPTMLTPLMDFGLVGFTIPHMRTAQQAKEIVDMVHYAPKGRRGYCGGGRAQRFGEMPMERYISEFENEITLSVIIEDAEGIQNYEEIFSVPGIDCCSVGPGDLSEAMGLTAKIHHPDVVAMTKKIMDCAASHGIRPEPTVIAEDKTILLNMLKTCKQQYAEGTLILPD